MDNLKLQMFQRNTLHIKGAWAGLSINEIVAQFIATPPTLFGASLLAQQKLKCILGLGLASYAHTPLPGTPTALHNPANKQAAECWRHITPLREKCCLH